MNFTADHLVKIDPGFNAEVSIYNGKDPEIKLNSKKRTTKLIGDNYKVKSNNDVMIYFYGKINPYLGQIKTPKEEKGKNIQIQILNKKSLEFNLDFGFEGYNSLHLIDISKSGNGIFYIEKLYDKLETELVEDEYLYIYYVKEDDQDIKINYISKNLNNPKKNILLQLYQKLHQIIKIVLLLKIDR